MSLIVPDENELDSIRKVADMLDTVSDKAHLMLVSEARNFRLELPNCLFRVLMEAAQPSSKGSAIRVMHYEKP